MDRCAKTQNEKMSYLCWCAAEIALRASHYMDSPREATSDLGAFLKIKGMGKKDHRLQGCGESVQSFCAARAKTR
jgi:hypothetical protein